jgi:hypothetical protein
LGRPAFGAGDTCRGSRFAGGSDGAEQAAERRPLDIGPAQLVPTGTYPIKDGLRRSFILANESEALRCVGRERGDGWRTELLVRDTAGAAPASGQAAELVEGFLDSAGVDPALLLAEEAQRLNGR